MYGKLTTLRLGSYYTLYCVPFSYVRRYHCTVAFFSVLRCSSSHQSLGPVLVSLPKPSPTPKPQRCFECNQHIIKIIVDKIPKDFWHLRSLVVVNASPFYKEFLRMCVGANYPLFLSFAFCLSSAGTLKCLRVCVFIFAAERAKADSISCMYNFY